MNIKPPDKVLKVPVTTWLAQSDYDKFRVLAEDNKVSVAAYLRAVVNDVLVDEEVRGSVSNIIGTKS